MSLLNGTAPLCCMSFCMAAPWYADQRARFVLALEAPEDSAPGIALNVPAVHAGLQVRALKWH